IVGSGLAYLARHQELVDAWWAQVRAGQWGIAKPSWAGSDGWSLVKMCLWLLPKVALGLSGFEMSLVAMTVIQGEGRAQVASTRKLVVACALTMGALLVGSAVVTTLLMTTASMLPGGAARERALAYLAHGGELAPGIEAGQINPVFGPVFGTVYDATTVLVLC